MENKDINTDENIPLEQEPLEFLETNRIRPDTNNLENDPFITMYDSDTLFIEQAEPLLLSERQYVEDTNINSTTL